MLTRKCGIDCPEIGKRRRRAQRATGNAQNYHRTTNWRSTSYYEYDKDSSDATEYKSLPGRNSTSSYGSHSSIGNIEDVETPSQTSEETLIGSSECLSGRDYSSRQTQTEDNYDDRSRESRQGHSQRFFDNPKTISRSTTTPHRTYDKSSAESHRSRSSFADGLDDKSCINDECSSQKSNLLFQGKDDSDSERTCSDSEIQSELSNSESTFCSELCENEIQQIPSSKIRCESSCPKQTRLDKLREKRQARLDRYILNKGFNYFEDVCHCSLKCLMVQICLDPFIKKTIISATFFFLGIKLCFELDSWYIPF
ncbi:hypothetical protein PV325_013536 [Microctonus aethiopoides]|nr:hypothetical protein PV325_013536 [Microctonus aethiopoides]